MFFFKQCTTYDMCIRYWCSDVCSSDLERGAIFTRREVVDFILDLVGYTSERPLQEQALLEPSFGDGDFLLVAIDRLLAAWRKQAPDAPAGVLADGSDERRAGQECVSRCKSRG